jgi:hypothetical protein
MVDRAWQVPNRVWVEGRLLRSETLPEDLTEETRSNPWRRLAEPMLRHFLELAEDEDDAIAAYAGNNGLLHVCPHGIPGFHHSEAPGSIVIRRFFTVGAKRTAASDRTCSSYAWFDVAAEPLSTWRNFSRSCRALLEAAAAVHSRRLPERNSFARLTGINPAQDDQLEALLPTLQVALAGVIDQLLAAYGVRLEFSWAVGPPELAFATSTLTSALVLDLASACAKSSGIAICTNCSRPYVPARKPASGRRRYCESCRKQNAPLRDAQRDSRARRASLPQAHVSGRVPGPEGIGPIMD